MTIIEKIEKYAFIKGLRELEHRDKEAAQECIKKIGAALKEGGLTRRGFELRLAGFTVHSPADMEKITRIFGTYKISDPWGA